MWITVPNPVLIKADQLEKLSGMFYKLIVDSDTMGLCGIFKSARKSLELD